MRWRATGVAHALARAASSAYGLLAFGALLTFLVLLAQSSGMFDRAELVSYDLRMRLPRLRPMPVRVALVAVDSTTVANNQRGTVIPRRDIATAIDYLRRAHAKAIGINFIYASPSTYGPKDDRALARALKQAGNVVLLFDVAVNTADSGTSTNLVREPIPLLAQSAATEGEDVIDRDVDGTARSTALPGLLLNGLAGQRIVFGVVSFGLDVVALALHETESRIMRSLPSRQMYINYAGPDDPSVPITTGRGQSQAGQTFPTYDIGDINAGLVPPSTFHDKVALIIPFGPVFLDEVQTPFGPMNKGVIDANIVNTILNGDPIRPAGNIANDGITLLLGLTVAAATALLRPKWGLFIAGAGAVLFAGAAVVLFEEFQIWISVVAPEVAIIVVLVWITVTRRRAQRLGEALASAADLQRARAQLVTLREEERRRLRRDLHDGLGPALASILLNLNAARRLLGPQSPAEPVLQETRADIQAVIADIRRVAYDLRPPALDELGFVGAVRQAAAGYEREGLTVTVEAPNDCPPLPAAVEVAAYRIIQEALTNVVRHAAANRCTVRISCADGIDLAVIDDGVGMALERHAGVGMSSMRERAAELSGTCVVEPEPGGGTRVLARIPIPKG